MNQGASAPGRERWIQGIDEPLPEGEPILWRGSPEARAVARHVLHERAWVTYLALLAVGVLVSAAGDRPAADVAKLMLPPLALAMIGWAGLRAMARAIARSTEYVVTSRRIVLRAGVAFPIAINIPLRLVDEAGLHVFGDGSGELQLRLSPRVKLAYIALWPHVETMRHLAHPRPKLRGLGEPQRVGTVLQQAIAQDAARDGTAIALGEPAGAPSSAGLPRLSTPSGALSS